jgi:hypothetical protein
MNTHGLGKRGLVIGLAAAASLAVAGGIAYATIPDGNRVFTACMLNNVGTLRLIDPSLPSSSLMSRCRSFETQVMWNQHGLNGSDGANGTNGQDGVSVTSAVEPPGANCSSGGARFTSASDETYACNGTPGTAGAVAQVIVLSGNSGGSYPPRQTEFTFVGPPATITTDASQRLVGSASAQFLSLDPDAGLNGFIVGLCYQPSAGGSLEEFSGSTPPGNVVNALVYADTPAFVPVSASVVPGVGTWNVGYCVKNTDQNVTVFSPSGDLSGWVLTVAG